MDIRHILAPTAFSDYSKKALSDALDLAQTFGAKLLLPHVFETSPYLGGFIPPAMGADLQGDLERRASTELAQVLQDAQGATIEVTRAVTIGSPPQTIVETAEAEHVDLIVMATYGRTGLSHLLIGSVAERVVRTAPCPVLTIRPPEVIGEVWAAEDQEFYTRREQTARDHLARLGHSFEERGVPRREEVVFGHRAPEIVRYAGEAGVDLIVLKSHRIDLQNPSAGWGTVSYKVGILAQCPVLLVK